MERTWTSMALETRRARSNAEGAQHHLDDATAATEPRRPNGGGVQMEPEHFATLVGFITLN